MTIHRQPKAGEILSPAHTLQPVLWFLNGTPGRGYSDRIARTHVCDNNGGAVAMRTCVTTSEVHKKTLKAHGISFMSADVLSPGVGDAAFPIPLTVK